VRPRPWQEERRREDRIVSRGCLARPAVWLRPTPLLGWACEAAREDSHGVLDHVHPDGADERREEQVVGVLVLVLDHGGKDDDARGGGRTHDLSAAEGQRSSGWPLHDIATANSVWYIFQ